MLIYTLGIIALVTFIGYYITRKKRKLPPGPPGLPFFGNVFQLDKTGPHKTITDWVKDYGDVFTIKIFGNDFVVLNSFETIYEGLVTKANDFAGRPKFFRFEVLTRFYPNIVFGTFTRRWVFMKKLTMSTMKMYGTNLLNLETISIDVITDMMEELEKKVEKKEAFDVEPIVHSCTTGIISSILFGTKLKDANVRGLLEAEEEGQVVLGDGASYMLLDIWPWLRFLPLRSQYNNLIKLRDKSDEWFLKAIAATKERYEPGDPKCFLDGLFEYQRTSAEKQMEFTLTDDDIYGINSNLIFAGTVTTSTTLKIMVALWINKPWLQKKMADEISTKIGQRTPTLQDRAVLTYTEAAILEVLRYSSIVTLDLPHCTTVDTSVGGYDIPKDTRVFFNLWKLHHDAEFWEEPWEFKPERFLDEHNKVVPPDHPNRKRVMAFGASRRVCVGETLARSRLFLMIVSLLQRFEFRPESDHNRPLHDPRDYICGSNIFPPKYKCLLSYRVTN